MPSLALIFIVLGTIFLGLVTPTEAGAMGVVGALILAAINRRLSWTLLYEGMVSIGEAYLDGGVHPARQPRLQLSSSRAAAAATLNRVDADLAAGRQQVGFLVFVNLFEPFVMAFFLDFFRDRLHHHPVADPRRPGAQYIDLVWFGVMICANMQTSFMHPPFGFALFYLRGIIPREQVKSSDIYWGAIPWVVLQLILVAVLIFWPGLVTDFIGASGPGDLTNVQIVVPPPDNGPSTDAPPTFN